ncbi:hypothetical protein C8R44DRAFT_754947 [Mycena epipterygia]|nr:hypothetical protein C8R44DRAFT_754947 [Mycena epipterygia]
MVHAGPDAAPPGHTLIQPDLERKLGSLARSVSGARAGGLRYMKLLHFGAPTLDSPTTTDEVLHGVSQKLEHHLQLLSASPTPSSTPRVERPEFQRLQRLQPPRKRAHTSAPSSPPPAKTTKLKAMPEGPQADVVMGEKDKNNIPLRGPTSYNPPVRDWSEEAVKENHCDEIVQLINENPENFMAAVILASDFHDRESGPSAIKSILVENKLPDAEKIDVFPPTPKAPVASVRSMPFTNIISDCTPAFKTAVLASSVFHGLHQGTPYSFYIIDVKPETPWIIATFVGLSDLMSPDEFRNAALNHFLADPTIVQMITADHGNVPGDHNAAFIFRVILHFADVGTCTIRRRGGGPPIVAHRILIPPFSLNADANRVFQNYLMSPTFTLNVPKRGVATSWRGSDPHNPTLMSCADCHGVDHYIQDCSIVNSPGYRAVHGMPEEDTSASSSVPTALTATHAPAPANDWTHVTYRGAGRGRARGGRFVFFPRYGGGRGRDTYGGYSRGGYIPYH